MLLTDTHASEICSQQTYTASEIIHAS